MTKAVYQELRSIGEYEKVRAVLLSRHYDPVAIDRVYRLTVAGIKEVTGTSDVSPYHHFDTLGFVRYGFDLEDVTDYVMHEADLSMRYAWSEQWIVETVLDLWLGQVLRCLTPLSQSLLRPVVGCGSPDSSLLMRPVDGETSCSQPDVSGLLSATVPPESDSG